MSIVSNKITTETNKNAESESHIIRNALSAIAKEMQSYQNSVTNGPSKEYTTHENIFHNLLQCKSTLKSKNKVIKNLQNKLNTAHVVANIAMTQREKNNTTLMNNVNATKSECIDVRQKNTNNVSEVINGLLKKNNVLSNELDNLANFIELCYRELQNIRKEKCDDASIIQQLKKIITCCGQYYADYRNEHEKNKQLEQKHCFLNNKLKILNKNLDAFTEEVRNLKLHNMRLESENNILKDKVYKLNGVTPNTSEHQIDDSGYCAQNCSMQNEKTSYLQPHSLDLKPHLQIVRKLLNDQNELINDFKTLSDIVI